MLTSTLSVDPSAAAATAGEPSATAPGGPSAEGGERFAEELAQAQSNLPPGQNLAAGAPPLQTMALGPTLEVITASSDQPDGDSLAAFAKAQGLDDDVVAWLFSDATQAQVQAQAMVAIPVPPGVMALPGTPDSDPAKAAAGLAAGAALTSPLQTESLAGVLTPAPSGAGTAGLAGSPGQASATGAALPGTPAATPGLSLPAMAGGLPNASTPAAAAAVTDGAAAAMAAGTTIAAGRAGWLRDGSTAPSIASLARDGVGAADDTALTPTQAAAAQVQALTLGNAIRSGRAGTPADAAAPTTTTGDMPVEILSLEMEPGLEALWDDNPAGQQPHSGFTNADPQGASAASAGQDQSDEGSPAATTGQRAAAYQELSQRLGEAMAKRVLSQVERGNWEVRLLLKPARLGEVEIELSMRSGALDAAFRATNPVTRDLLNDGLNRLREVLAGAGMDIAGLNVGNGRSQQSGGNPTPRQSEGTVAAPRDAQAAPAPVSVAAPRLRSTGSGWDVLV